MPAKTRIHPVAPGKRVIAEGDEWESPKCPPLCAEDVALYLKRGVILPPPEPVADPIPTAPAPSEAPASPAISAGLSPSSDADQGEAGAPWDFPDPLPFLDRLADHFADKSVEYIKAMQEIDTRRSPKAQTAYRDALAAAEARS